MRKGLAKILICIIIINTVFSTGLINIFANSKAQNIMQLKWNSTKALTDALDITERTEDSDEAFLSFDIDKNNGNIVNTGAYKLSYYDSQGQKVELLLEKGTSNVTVTYSIDGKSDADKTNNRLEVYKLEEKSYKQATGINFPPTDSNFCIAEFFDNGKGYAKKASFKITKGKGFAFKYKGKNIKFKYDDSGLFYFSTNGINQGNIYDFTLDYFSNMQKPYQNPTNSQKISIFTGIKKDTFESKPIANDGKGTENNPIDQTIRPITEFTGKNPKLEISFDIPKRFVPASKNKTNGSWEIVDSTRHTNGIKTVLNLNSIDSSQTMQIIIKDICKISDTGLDTPNPLIEVTEGIKVTGLKKISGNRISFTIENKSEETPKIVPGIIYNPVTIYAESNDTNLGTEYFETIKTSIPIGKVYTYIEYEIVSLGSKEFYIKFKPFKNYNGFYTIMNGIILEPWSVYEEKNKGAEEVMIPVPLELVNENTPESKFRIDFTFTPSENKPQSQQTLQSQVVKYKGYKSDIILNTPENLQVLEADIIRESGENGSYQDQLYVTFKWDVSYQEVLKALYQNNNNQAFDITYNFFESLKPESQKENHLTSVKFNVSFNGEEGIFTVKENTDETGEQKPKFLEGKTEQRVETISGTPTKVISAIAKFKIPVSAKADANNFQLQYPNIYFITTQGDYTINNKKNTTGKSLPATLTLNGLLNIEVTPPQNIKILEKSVTNKSLTVVMDKLTYVTQKEVLYDYVNRLLERYFFKIAENGIKYNFYITQEKQLLDEMRKNDGRKIDKIDGLPQAVKDKIKIVKTTKKIGENESVDCKTETIFNGNQTKIIDELRAGNVVKIESLTQGEDGLQKVNFTGLDENQTYYIMAETLVDLQSLKNENAKQDISKYSQIVTATTLKDNEVPQDTEKTPSAPLNFNSKDTNLNSTNLIWDAVTEVSEPGQKSTLEYQFIKVQGQALPKEFLNTKNSFEKSFQELEKIKEKEGFKTSSNKILEYKDKSFIEATKERYEYANYNGLQRRIIDKTLSPNQIYFYYIRTVRIVDGKDVAYSVWVPLSVTTKNVEGPTNLKVERNLEYDKKSEVIISFDSPKISKDLIGKEYNFQYSIKKDNGEWEKDKDMPKEDLKIEDNKDGKTMKVTYKIKGLKSGSLYTIRVRLYNIPLKSASIYSNEVDHRTDSDINDNDYDENINNWEDNFKELVSKLKKEPYWFIENSLNITSVIYRPEYFDNILSSTNTSIIDLPEGIGGNYKEYYLPANAILKAFEQNKGFKIKFNNMEIIYSPKSISPIENDAIKELQDKKSKENIADYFVKIKAHFKPVEYLIEGNKNNTPVVELSLEVLGTKETTLMWDYYSVSHIDALLKTSKYSTDIREIIKKMLDDKKDNLFISKEINKLVDNFKADFGRKVLEETKEITKRTFYSYKLNGNIIILTSNIEGFISKGYKLILGNWSNVPTSDYAGKKAIFTQEFGNYTFTATKLIINGIQNVPNGAIINNIIIKYGLDDYFGKNGNINLKANLTRDMAIGSLARIAGNSKTRNPIEFFKAKGIIISGRNGTSPISIQETIYTTMKVYEIKTNKKIEAIKIRNYNKTANIKGISEKYKKAIQVAFELGIYTNENINPNGTMTVQEFLQMLVNLSSKIGI